MNAKSGLVFALLSAGVIALPQTAMAEGDKDSKEDSADNGAEAGTEDASAETESEEAKQVAMPVGTAGYDKGFFISDGGVNKLSIQGRVQGRMEYTSVDKGSAPRANRHAFLLPRARLTMKGTAYTTRLIYKFQSDFGKGQVALKDFYLDYRVGEGDVHVRLGQFKMPFGREFLNSSSKLEFVDRTIVNSYIGNSRDVGLEVHNNLSHSPKTEWAVGVFNGTGDKGVFQPAVEVDPTTMETTVVGGKFSNVPEKIRPAVALRIGHNSEGMKGYSEADLEGGDFRYGVAFASLNHFQYGAGAASSRDGVDFVVKQDGMSATGGVYADLQGADFGNLSYAGVGAYAQAGYMLDDKKQVALRYASVTEEGGNNQQEVSGAYSFYKFSHGLKWQSDVSYLHRDDGAKRQDIRVRSQVQLSF